MFRNWRLRYVALMTIVLPLVLLLAPVCVTLLDWLTNGRNIPTEVLSIWVWTVTITTVTSPTMLIWFTAVIVFYAVNNLVIKPARAAKRMRERDPEGAPFVYDFYEDRLEIKSSSQSSDETIRVKYADVQRRIRESRYILMLSTGQRNRFLLYKTIMTPEEASQMVELLCTRCPQRRVRN